MPLLQTADKPVSPHLAKSGNATFTNCRQNLCHRVLLNLEMPHSQTADKPVLSRLAKSGNATFTNCRQNPCHRVWLSLEMPNLQTAEKPVSPRLPKSEIPYSQTADKHVSLPYARSGNATFTNFSQSRVTTTG